MANYPSTQNTDDNLYIAVNNLSTVLTDDPLSDSATTVNVSDASSFPSVGIITIDLEAIHYTGKTATSFTGCTRGFDGTTAASHLVNATVFHDIPAAHHNVLKDEIKAISDDLRAVAAALDDADTPASTATDAKDRLDQVVSQLKAITGETNWYDSPATTVSALDTLLDSTAAALDDTDTPASTASDLKDRLDQIVSQLKAITGETNWYDTPDNTIAALESGTVKTTGAQSIAGVKTFTDDPVISDTTEPQLDISETTNSIIVRHRASNSGGNFAGTVTNHDYELRANNIPGVQLDASNGSAAAIKGTSTNDNATTGYVGETVSSVVGTYTNFAGSTSYGNLTSISITPGDWLVSMYVEADDNGATVVDSQYGLGTNPSTTAGLAQGDTVMTPGAFSGRVNHSIPSRRYSIGSSTTIYLKYYAQYSVATPQAVGRLTAVRIR